LGVPRIIWGETRKSLISLNVFFKKSENKKKNKNLKKFFLKKKKKKNQGPIPKCSD